MYSERYNVDVPMYHVTQAIADWTQCWQHQTPDTLAVVNTIIQHGNTRAVYLIVCTVYWL